MHQARSVEVDVDQERGQADGVPGRGEGRWPEEDGGGDEGNTPKPVSCQLAGSRRRGASVKNWLA
jgi:hypothetical protein